MKSAITVYKILTYLLFPYALILAFACLPMLIIGFMVPPAFIALFLMASVVLYIILSAVYLHKVIINVQECSKKLYDWLKVNAFVTIAFASLTFIQTAGVFTNPQALEIQIQEAMAMQQKQMATTAMPSSTLMIKVAKTMFYGMFFYAVVLIVHLLLTFRFIGFTKKASQE